MKRSVKILWSIGVACCLMAVMASCSEDPENVRQDISLDVATRSVAENLKNFYFDFTKDAVASVDNDLSSTTNNVIVSPLSAAQVLGMLVNGFDEDTSSQIIDYLGVDDIYSLNDFSYQMLKGLPKVDAKTNLSLNNYIWVDKNYNLKSDYNSILSSYYSASIDNIDFSDKEEAAKNMGSKSGCSSNDLLSLFMPFDEIYMVAINTLSFQSPWAKEYFKVGKAQKEDFFGMNGTTTVYMMHSNKIDANYNFDDDFEICTLKFGNEGYYIDILLPNKDLSSDEVARLLTQERIESLKSQMVSVVLYLALPRIELTNYVSLNSVLKQAGLSAISERVSLPMLEPFVESDILLAQNSKLTLDEEGVVIKVVSTGVEGAYSLAELGKQYYMTVDHPFYFFINEQSTGACLLSGRIADIP